MDARLADYFDVIAGRSRVIKESKIVVTTKPKKVSLLSPSRRTHNHNVFLGNIF